MKCSSWGQTDPGLLRTTNQDAFVVGNGKEYPFFVVADGMGGHAGGEEASQLASSTMEKALTSVWETEVSSQEMLYKAVLSANDAILSDQLDNPERADMGTTLVTAIYRNGQWWFAHVGDSRLYRIRNKEIKQITEDHTWVARAVKMGELTSDQARSHPWRHVLMQCLGREECQQIDIHTMDVRQGDWLLLCSDGLTEELTDLAISDCLQAASGLEDAVNRLVEGAKAKGGRDNITVVLVSVDELSQAEVDTAPEPGLLLMEKVLAGDSDAPEANEDDSDDASAETSSPYGEDVELVE
ncbi:MAG: Stp1/IreP family PP2C-type Ser/Thr phosphatase [Cyanobacteria bacterium P01_D01_bin.73]